MERHHLEITWASLWRVFAMVLLALALYHASNIIVMVLFALVISSAIYGPVNYLHERGVPRTLGVIVLFLVGLGLIALVLYAIIPVALIQLKFLLGSVGSLNIPALEVLGTPDVLSQIDSNLSGLLETVFAGGTSIFNFVSIFLGNVFFIGVSLVIAFYLAISKDGVERFIRAIIPLKNENYALDLYIRTRNKLSRWLGGQIVLSIFIAVLTFIGLQILGIEYALVLAVLAGILELIPYVGPIAVGLFAFLIALPESLTLALLVILVFFIIQQLENHILVPVVMSRAIGVDPVVVAISILAGAQIAGFAGILLAVPVVILIQELVDDWSMQKEHLRESTAKK